MKVKKICILLTYFCFSCSNQPETHRAKIIEDAGQYRIKVKNKLLVVTPAIGGRITSLKLNGNDFLTGKEVNDFNWGSTFWPSPQSEWGWPPPAEIDNKPYSTSIEDNVIKMVSLKAPESGLVVTKEFSGNFKNDYYNLKYTITNKSDSTQKVAAWENTRVQTKGFAFFPMGKGNRTGGLRPLTFEKKGIVWFNYKEEEIPTESDRQLYADGSEGWIAQVNKKTILVKKFQDVPFDRIAPKEGEIQLFTTPVKPENNYVEIENEGPYETLKPGASLEWKVKWYLRELPDSIKSEAGNQNLVNYVRNI